MVGYEPNGYKVWNPECEKCVVVRDVIVDETNFSECRPSLKSEENILNSRDKTDEGSSKSVSTKSRNSDGLKSDTSKSDEYVCPSKIRKVNHDTVESISKESDSASVSGNVKQTNTDNKSEFVRSFVRMSGWPILVTEFLGRL